MDPDPIMTCPGCGAILPPEAAVCRTCNIAVVRQPAPPAPVRSRWYHNIWFVLVMIFFVLGPFALPLIWKNPRLSRTMKLTLSGVALLYTLWMVDLTVRATRAVMNQMRQFESTLSL